jgi:hypothetical protein
LSGVLQDVADSSNSRAGLFFGDANGTQRRHSGRKLAKVIPCSTGDERLLQMISVLVGLFDQACHSFEDTDLCRWDGRTCLEYRCHFGKEKWSPREIVQHGIAIELGPKLVCPRIKSSLYV